MSTLGIGVRVYVGWAADGEPEVMCSTGTIVAGPYEVGEIPPWAGSGYCQWRSWDVDMDNGTKGYAAECLLTPIDDDTTTHTQEAEVEA